MRVVTINDPNRTVLDVMTNWNGGTSFSSPFVAGVGAARGNGPAIAPAVTGCSHPTDSLGVFPLAPVKPIWGIKLRARDIANDIGTGLVEVVVVQVGRPGRQRAPKGRLARGSRPVRHLSAGGAEGHCPITMR